MPAPAITSVSQWRLLRIRDRPVTAAAVYPPMLSHGSFHPYSLCSIVAVRKAVAVWPDGKELRRLPSGRIRAMEYFIPFTVPAIIAAEKASLTNIRPHSLLPSYPLIFRPSITPAGAYWR